MNNVSMLGRLIKDVELKYTQSGTAMGRFTVAVDRGMSKDKKAEAQAKGYPTSDFINCKAIGKTAELIAQYFAKGDMIGLEGSIQTGKYDNAQGVTVYTTDVMVSKLHFVGGNKSAKLSDTSYNTDDFASMENDQDCPF